MKTYKAYQLAKKLNVSTQTIYRWIRERKIPAASVRKIKVVKEILVIDFPK